MDTEKKKKTLSYHIQQIFITGTFVITPIVVTFYLVMFIYGLLTKDIMPIVMKFFDMRHIVLNDHLLQFVSLLFVIILLFIVGLIARVYFGRKIINFIDYLMSKIPIARTIYNGTKQVVDSFSATSSSTFSKVVMVEYPRRDMWMIAFVVRNTEPYMQKYLMEDECYNLFIPTAPNPTSGVVGVVKKSDCREVDVTVEDGIKFVLSVGMLSVVPEKAEEVIKNTLDKDNDVS